MGNTLTVEQIELRRRIAAWFRYVKAKHGITNEKMADRMGLPEPTITNILNEQRWVGLDTVYALREAFRESVDVMFDDWPKGEDGTLPDPRPASSSAAHPTRRRKTGA